MPFWRTFLLNTTVASVLAFECSGAIAQTPNTVLGISPLQPAANEPIQAVLRFALGGCIASGTKQLVVNGQDLTIVHAVTFPALALQGPCSESFDFDGLPAGRYRLSWVLTSAVPPPFPEVLGQIEFVVGDGGPPLPIPMLSGTALLLLIVGLTLLMRKSLLGTTLAPENQPVTGPGVP